MKKIFLLLCIICASSAFGKKVVKDLWPDGTEIDSWFKQTETVNLNNLGKKYRITDYGVVNDGKIHTKELQNLIDKIATEGGGVVIVPEGGLHDRCSILQTRRTPSHYGWWCIDGQQRL